MLDEVPETLARILAQEGVPALPQSDDEVIGQFVLWDSARKPGPHLHPGQVGIDVAGLRRGPQDPFRLLNTERSNVHGWRCGSLLLEETVSVVDRRAIRRFLIAQLRRKVEEAGGVWLRLSCYPYPYRTAFNFRIDYDDYDEEDFATTLALVERQPDRFTHFVCSSAYENHAEAVDRLRGCDVQPHGHWHHTYRNKNENLANIRRSIDWLEGLGFSARGFAAPHGRFHRGLLAALDELQVGYSSEFALAYDDLPFFPQKSTVLQVPVHPICLGLFLDAAEKSRGTGSAVSRATAVDMATAYFENVIRRKYAAGDPIFLYGHPTGRLGTYPEVLAAVLQRVSGLADVWYTTLTEFAGWWRSRQDVVAQLHRRGRVFTLFVDRQSLPLPLGVEFCRGSQVALFQSTGPLVRFVEEELDFEVRRSSKLPQAHRIDRPESVREIIKRQIDWETVTPSAEIKDRTWRGWTKWLLRQLRNSPR